ncbi:MAG: DUF7544 domain-containing protein [Chthoniobacterales bacterium]
METDPAPLASKVEVFAPCSAALDLTKLILFQPFNLSKWFVIGFAAFLSHLNGGGGGSFNWNSKLGRTNWSFRSVTHDAYGSLGDIPSWVFPLIAIGAILGLAFLLLLMWLGARGKFIFTDCVVRNRGAIEEPWREYRREGNSYFLYSLVVMLCVVAVLALVGMPLWLPLLHNHEPPAGASLVLGLILLGGAALVAAVVVKVVSNFMIPLMYRRRCGAAEALSAALGLIATHAGPVILYVLFNLVLWLAFALIACLTTCLTCCLTALPYVGTVILLPAHVFFLSYLLLFVRQFGPDCDVWASIVRPTEPPPPPVLPA